MIVTAFAKVSALLLSSISLAVTEGQIDILFLHQPMHLFRSDGKSFEVLCFENKAAHITVEPVSRIPLSTRSSSLKSSTELLADVH